VREVLGYIERRVAQLRESAFITWLADDSVPARDRLMRWLPCAAPWVFGFMDLNGILLRYGEDEARDDPYKRAINDHLEEDAQHWTFYLEDLRRFELDAPVDLPETLRFLWGDVTRAQRLAVYRLAALASRSRAPLVRYALIATLEALAHVVFDTLVRVADPFAEQTGQEALYVGAVHAELEPGHLTRQTGAVEARIQAEVLDGPTRRECLDVARQVCDVVAERWDELHRFGQSDAYRTFLRSA
jgi:hypothetical protein